MQKFSGAVPVRGEAFSGFGGGGGMCDNQNAPLVGTIPHRSLPLIGGASCTRMGRWHPPAALRAFVLRLRRISKSVSVGERMGDSSKRAYLAYKRRTNKPGPREGVGAAGMKNVWVCAVGLAVSLAAGGVVRVRRARRRVLRRSNNPLHRSRSLLRRRQMTAVDRTRAAMALCCRRRIRMRRRRRLLRKRR